MNVFYRKYWGAPGSKMPKHIFGVVNKYGVRIRIPDGKLVLCGLKGHFLTTNILIYILKIHRNNPKFQHNENENYT